MSLISIAATAVALPCAFALTRAGQIWRHGIVSTHGIEECSYVRLGGIKQYIQIRGQDTRNPLILFLHGGPGNPTSCLSYHYQKQLEQDYTLVNWDQRGCGRTFYQNHGKDAPVTCEQILRDLGELVEYLCVRFGKQKIILLGYSWGTVPGVLYAQSHPERLHCYLSVCQCVHILSGTVYAAAQVAARARLAGDTPRAERLEAQIKAFSALDRQFSSSAFMAYAKLRNATCTYQKCADVKSTAAYIRTGLLSPDSHMRDLRWKLRQMIRPHAYLAHEKALISYLSMEFDLRRVPPNFAIPVYFLTADDDRICPADMIEEYYRGIRAPDKRLLRIPGQTHTVFFDKPEVFCNSVRSLLQHDVAPAAQ